MTSCIIVNWLPTSLCLLSAVCFCVAYAVRQRKRELAEDLAALEAEHAAGSTLGRKGNMDLTFLRQVWPVVTSGC